MFNFSKKVALIDLKGVISDGGKDITERHLEAIYDIADSKKYSGIILRIDSPGGAPALSQEIHEAIFYAREQDKVVIASVGGCAASGGYMIASACEKIFASSTSIIGSIGVIMQLPNYTGLAQKLGVKMVTVKSGEKKDAGNPFREMSDEEKDYFQNLSSIVYKEFIDIVAKGRGKPLDEIKEIAEGKIYDGRTALKLGLIDELGGYKDALDSMYELLETDKITFVDKSVKQRFNIREFLGIEAMFEKMFYTTIKM